MEVYRKGTLHKALGVPKGNLYEVSPSTSTRLNGYGDRETSQMLGEADMETGTESEVEERRQKRDRYEKEDTGRYAIGTKSERWKRRRLDNGMVRADASHRTVFTTDDDAEYGGEGISSDDREDGEYNLEDEEGNSRTKSRRHDRRSYWLSKGIGSR